MKSTPDVLPCFIAEKNVKLFTKHHVFTEGEIHSRYEILLEEYGKTLHIEAKTMKDMIVLSKNRPDEYNEEIKYRYVQYIADVMQKTGHIKTEVYGNSFRKKKYIPPSCCNSTT